MFDVLTRPTGDRYVDTTGEDLGLSKETESNFPALPKWNDENCPRPTSLLDFDVDFPYLNFGSIDNSNSSGIPTSMLDVLAYAPSGMTSGVSPLVPDSSLDGNDRLLPFSHYNVKPTDQPERHGGRSGSEGLFNAVNHLFRSIGSEIPASVRSVVHDAEAIDGWPGPFQQGRTNLHAGDYVLKELQDSSNIPRTHEVFLQVDQAIGPDEGSPTTSIRKRKRTDTDSVSWLRRPFREPLLGNYDQAPPIACRLRKGHQDIDMNVTYTEKDEGKSVHGISESGASALDNGSSHSYPYRMEEFKQDNIAAETGLAKSRYSLDGETTVSEEVKAGLVIEDEALVKMMGWFPLETIRDYDVQSNLSVHWVIDEAPLGSDLPHLELLENAPTKFWSPNLKSAERPPIQIGYLHSEPSQSSHSVQFFLNDSPMSSPEVNKATLGFRQSSSRDTDPPIFARQVLTPGRGDNLLHGWASSTRRESVETNVESPIKASSKAVTKIHSSDEYTSQRPHSGKTSPRREDWEDSLRAIPDGRVNEAEGSETVCTRRGEGIRCSDQKISELPQFSNVPTLINHLDADRVVQNPMEFSKKEDVGNLRSFGIKRCSLHDTSQLSSSGHTKPLVVPSIIRKATSRPGVPNAVTLDKPTRPCTALLDVTNHMKSLAAKLRESLEKKIDPEQQRPTANATVRDVEKTKLSELATKLGAHQVSFQEESRPSNYTQQASRFDTKARSIMSRSRRKTPKGTRVELPVHCKHNNSGKNKSASKVHYIQCPSKIQEVDDVKADEHDDEVTDPASVILPNCKTEIQNSSSSKLQSSKYRGVTRYSTLDDSLQL